LLRVRRLLLVPLVLLVLVGGSAISAQSQADFSALIQEVAPSVVWITLDVEIFGENIIVPAGSGFLTKFNEADPLTIVTACHVVVDPIESGIVNGEEIGIVFVHPEIQNGFNQQFAARVLYCDSLLDVAILEPLALVEEAPFGPHLYEPAPLNQFISNPGRAWFADSEPLLGQNIFAMGFPGSQNEFNVTFGRVTSRLKQLYLSGGVTEYFASEDDDGDCFTDTRIREDVAINIFEIGFLGAIPAKWGLDVMADVVEPGTTLYGIENTGKLVPFDDFFGPALWAGFVKEVLPDGTILVEERAYEIPTTRSFFSDICLLDDIDADLSFEETTGQILRLDQELEYIGTDAAMRGGSSGGPVFNDRGQLIGMALFEVTSNEGGNFFTRVVDLQRAYNAFIAGE